MAQSKHNVFITGGTGALGKDIIKELLTTTEDHLYLLVRKKKRISNCQRIKDILASEGLENNMGTRVHALEGDITEPRLGLSDENLNRLRDTINQVSHIAALTALNKSKDQYERINVKGTEYSLEIAKEWNRTGKLECFYYFSTVFVSGSKKKHHSYENQLPENPAHANYYEYSKYSAEKVVRKAIKEGLPTVIIRPSIVVGHSQTGQASKFNVIYPFVRMLAQGLLSKFPSRMENSLNIVPRDFVTRAFLAIRQKKSAIGNTLHLVSKQPPSVSLFVELKEREYPNSPPVELVDPDTFNPEKLPLDEQFVFNLFQSHLGYLNTDVSYDTKNIEEALLNTDISFPKTDYEFLKGIIQYAVDQRYIPVSH